MNREDIIRVAEEGGLAIEGKIYEDVVIAVATRVAAAEREACELTVDSLIISGPVSEVQQRHNWAYMHARDAIRARGET